MPEDAHRQTYVQSMILGWLLFFFPFPTGCTVSSGRLASQGLTEIAGVLIVFRAGYGHRRNPKGNQRPIGIRNVTYPRFLCRVFREVNNFYSNPTHALDSLKLRLAVCVHDKHSFYNEFTINPASYEKYV